MMIKTNKDNKEYLTINKCNLLVEIGKEHWPYKIRKEINQIISLLYNAERKIGYIDQFEIRKDSEIGEFLLFCIENGEIQNEDLNIDFEKITNAFNIAVFENNPIAKEILPLFQGREIGKKEELMQRYSEEAINFILENDDFETYLQKIDGKYKIKKYVVYEDGEFCKKDLMNKEQQKVKK